MVFTRTASVIAGICVTAAAQAQLDTKFEPREFNGSPTSVRVETAEEGKGGLFRVYSYDAKGYLTKIEQGSDRMGTTMTIVFVTDDSGRIMSSNANFMGNPTIKKVFTYDEKGRPMGHTISQLRTGKESGFLRIAYDDNGNPFQETSKSGNRPEEVLGRTFDEEGRRASEELRSNDRLLRKITMGYDDNGCLVKQVVVLPSGREIWSVWSRGEDCRPLSLSHVNAIGNRSNTSYTHDEHGNVLSEVKERTNGDENSSTVRMTWTYVYPEKASKEPKAPTKVAD